MTLNALLVFFEKYYGETYTGVFRETMIKYLNGYSADFYESASKVIVRRVSRNFRNLPCIAEIEKHMDEIITTMPKPKALEYKRECSEEERMAVLKEMDEIKNEFSKKQNSPMAKSFAKTLESMR